MQRGVFAEGDVGEVVVGAVGAERVHERAGLDVAVRARERAAVEVAGAAGEGECAVDDAGGRLVTKALAAWASANSACSSAGVPSEAGLAARCSSISAAARERTPRAAARSTALSATCMRARASPLMRPATPWRAIASADSAIPSEAAAWNSPATRLRSM